MMRYRNLTILISLIFMTFPTDRLMSADRTYTISKPMNLKGGTMSLRNGEALVFTGKGRISNGQIEGSSSSIVNDTGSPVFDNVELTGTWKGKVHDSYFNYDPHRKDHQKIIASMVKFNQAIFSARTYVLDEWRVMKMNRDTLAIKGNGARIVLPEKKAGSYALFDSDYVPQSYLEASDLDIQDNLVSGKPDVYYVFYPGHASATFSDIRYKGAGGLVGNYHVNHECGTFIFRRCEIRTSQFAIELGNRESSHTRSVLIDSCLVFRYSNALFVGPVSIVGEAGQVDTVTISNSRFEEKNAGNMELSGASTVIFHKNTCSNIFCFSGTIVPDSYLCMDNSFTLHSFADSSYSQAMTMAGKKISFTRNTVTVTSKPFPFITVLYPELVSELEMVGNRFIYEAEGNPPGFACLLSLKEVKGRFINKKNKFESLFRKPNYVNYFPE